MSGHVRTPPRPQSRAPAAAEGARPGRGAQRPRRPEPARGPVRPDGPLTPSSLLSLQARAGNAAVRAVIARSPGAPAAPAPAPPKLPTARVVRARGADDTAAVIWRDGSGAIVALLELASNDALDRYLRGQAQASELVAAGQATWAELSVSTSALPRPKPATGTTAGTAGADGGVTAGGDKPGAAATAVADIVTDFVPGVSNVKDLLTLLTGRNPLTGEPVGWGARLAAGFFAIPGLGNIAKYAAKGGKLLVKGGKLLGKAGKLLAAGGKAAWKRFKGLFKGLKRAKRLKPQQAAKWRAAFSASDKALQKKWKHAADFGVAGNYSPANATRYRNALDEHVQRGADTVIDGTYHKQKAILHVDSATGLTVVQKPSGEFWTGWKLNSQQLHHTLRHGSLGGG